MRSLVRACFLSWLTLNDFQLSDFCLEYLHIVSHLLGFCFRICDHLQRLLLNILELELFILEPCFLAGNIRLQFSESAAR